MMLTHTMFSTWRRSNDRIQEVQEPQTLSTYVKRQINCIIFYHNRFLNYTLLYDYSTVVEVSFAFIIPHITRHVYYDEYPTYHTLINQISGKYNT